MNIKNLTEKRGNWFETKEKLKNKFSKLSDNDFRVVDGRHAEMMERLQLKLGLSKDEISKIISNL
jgi:uncharacterized protein YjbJ (UPF0337 family)